MHASLKGSSRAALISLIMLLLVNCGKQRESVSLSGKWEIHKGFDASWLLDKTESWAQINIPATLRSIPEYREHSGYVTVRRSIPESIVSSQFPSSVFLSNLSDVSQVFINDVRIGGNGSVEPYVSGAFKSILADIPLGAIRQGRSNHITIVLYSPLDHSMNITGPQFMIGPSQEIYRNYYGPEIISMILIGIYLIAAAYHILLFLKRRKDFQYLYFALALFLISFYWFNKTESRDIFISSATIRHNLELASLYLIIPFLLAFFSQFLIGQVGKFVVGSGIFCAGLACMAFLPVSIVGSMDFNLFVYAFPFFIIHIFYLLKKGYAKRPRDVMLLLAGTFLVSAAALHDILVTKDIIPQNPHIARYTFILFVMGIAGSLANRFTGAITQTEWLNEELSLRNQELDGALAEVRGANETLEERVKERTAELQNVNSRLMQMDQIKSAFFANITHEFRTPLSLVLGTADLLKINARNSADISAEIDTIERNGRRLMKLINQLLDLARLDAKKHESVSAVIDVSKLLRDFVAQFQSAAQKKGIVIHMKCSEALVFSTEPESLETIIVNLIGNAVKFTEFGRIEVRAEIVEDWLRVSVSDTGPGISSEGLTKMFQRFTQVDQKISRRYEGAGIGLALSHELAVHLGGSLTVESEINRGSRFLLSLPAIRALDNEEALSAASPEAVSVLHLAELASHQSPRASLAGAGAPLILLIDDNGDMLSYLAGVLKNYRLDFARNGREAILRVRDRLPDLIITDIMMPVMDGMEFVRVLSTENEFQKIPVIFLTARSGEEDRFLAFRQGAVQYLIKPVSPPELLAHVEAQLQREFLLRKNRHDEARSLYADLHDHLGSAITDASILSAKAVSSGSASLETLVKLRALIRSIGEGLRNRLHHFDNLTRLENDFPIGVHLILLDRYSARGRQLIFSSGSAECSQYLRVLPILHRRELFSIMNEIATNDLKYGSGVSSWEMSLDDSTFNLAMRASTSFSGEAKGLGQRTIQERTERLGGSVFTIQGSEYSIKIALPARQRAGPA